MADYHPLIVSAVEALPERTPKPRRAVYTPTRAALREPPRAVAPPLSESDIARQGLSLDRAIHRDEAEHLSAATPAPHMIPAPRTLETVDAGSDRQAFPDEAPPPPPRPASPNGDPAERIEAPRERPRIDARATDPAAAGRLRTVA